MPAPIVESKQAERGSVYPFFADEQRLKFATFLSGLNGDDKFVDKANILITKEDFFGLCKLYVAESKHLFKVRDSQIESLFFLLIAFMQTLTTAEFEKLANSLAGIIEADDNKDISVSKIVILTHLYNALEVTSKARCTVYTSLVKTALKAGQLEYVIPTINKVGEWLKQWNSSASEKRNIYLLWSETLSALGPKYESLVYEQLLNYLTTLKDVPANEVTAELRKIALRTVELALKVPSVFNFELLINNSAAKQCLQKEPIWELLTLFVDKKQSDLKQWLQKPTSKTLLQTNNVNLECLEQKMRLLTLATLCDEALAKPNATVSYSDIARELEIDMADVERWVIEAVRCNLIMARLDQLEQSLQVQRTTFRTFSKAQWSRLADKLKGWNKELAGISQILENSKLN